MENEKELEKEVVIDENLIDDEDLKKNLQTVVAQKKHFREKYQSVSKDFEEYKKTHPDIKVEEKKEVVPVAEPKNTVSNEVSIESVLDLRTKGYSDAEILAFNKYAKKMNVPISEIIEDPFIKAGIEAERQKAKVEQTTPNPSNGTMTVKGKTWAQMTPEERKMNYDAFINGKGSNSNI
ncbi:MAG: hypothetical protein IPM48_14475 [Saprospiraceae bacterium]|nr:hypothetical protein [Saprospiraceae bacterium]